MTVPRPDLLRRVRKLPGPNPPAFVLGVESNGLSFLRSLGRRGIPVVAVDSWHNPGMVSRYCIPAVVPDAEENAPGLLRVLQELAGASPSRGVLIATGDAYVLFAAKYRRDLAAHFDLRVSDYETIVTASNKRRQYEFAQGQGIATPRTLFPEDHSIEDVAARIGYPSLVKPYFSHLWRNHPLNRVGKAAEVRTAGELTAAYRTMARSGLDFMVQETVAGGDDQLFGVYAYLDASSEPLGLFTKRKVRQYPRHLGDGSVHVGQRDPELAELSLKLLRPLRFQGLVNVEFKRDPQDGELKLVEINPRSGAANWIAVASGVDLPYLAYRDALNRPVERAMTFREDVKWIHLEKDLRSFLQGRREGETALGPWLRSLRGKRCYAYFAWDDPLPACMGVGNALRAAVGRRRRASV